MTDLQGRYLMQLNLFIFILLIKAIYILKISLLTSTWFVEKLS